MIRRKFLSFINVLIIIIITIGISGCKSSDLTEVEETITSVDNNMDESKATTDSQPTPIARVPMPDLPGKDSILLDGKVVLSIDDDEIFDYFKNGVFLCSENSKSRSKDRKMFCEDNDAFKSKTRFVSITESPDKTAIGFDIITRALQPDSIAGIFYPDRTDKRVSFLTDFYIGHTFLSFSPTGKYFVYKDSCWEGWCGLRIRNTETLEEISNLGDSEFVDMREANYTFVKWISDNEVEYKLGLDTKRETF